MLGMKKKGLDKATQGGILWNMKEPLIELDEVARILAVHKRTIKRWGAAGKVQLVELPGGQHRMPESELKRILSNVK